ncbi:cytochrome P450 [Dendrothele bispora CBS 962.96]|uniref:Cytochrome P450 n=1 Tax=Dendrothele bispora (strain CBS 962.96) TaxID=1314807 RepID=A0A4S8LQX9_DENBC|nr:cytochrome P450 [Dendrothele bispora CBS 962.96]
MLIYIAELLAVITCVLWLYLRRRRTRGHSIANLPCPKSKSWWKGNFHEALNPKAWDFHMRLLKEYGTVVRLDGLMGDKQLIVYDPKAMHHILVKVILLACMSSRTLRLLRGTINQDQTLYDRSMIEATALVFGKGLTGITGEAHRKQRKALNPVFSIAYMRNMRQLEKGLTRQLNNAKEPQEIEMISWMSRTALELIGQAGLGYSFDTLEDDTVTHPYSQIMKQLIGHISNILGDPDMWILRDYIVPFAVRFGSGNLRRWIVDMTPWPNLHRVRDMSDYLWQVAQEIYAAKKHAFAAGDEGGKDIISILMRMNLLEDSEDKLDEDEVLGQMSVLTFAAMDTTSTAMARTLQLLSTRPDIQDKLRQEVLEARAGDKDIPYDQLVSLPYLDAVCRETLRLFPPSPNIFRRSTQDAVLPLSKPITGIDGTVMTEIHVPKNTYILVSALNSNRDPDIWGPDALEWKPERWLSSLPNELIEAHIPGVYSHLMTFNAGWRSCIGFKFSQLEMKAVLSMLIAKFKFSPSDKTVTWKLNIISTPVVNETNETDRRPRMPLRVTKLEG